MTKTQKRFLVIVGAILWLAGCTVGIVGVTMHLNSIKDSMPEPTTMVTPTSAEKHLEYAYQKCYHYEDDKAEMMLHTETGRYEVVITDRGEPETVQCMLYKTGAPKDLIDRVTLIPKDTTRIQHDTWYDFDIMWTYHEDVGLYVSIEAVN